ncbi:MAG: type II secretion system protein M [Planctomycetes bacterium]|nr:type II secretion system protein M [Planctomycetota bacterium]
MARGRGSWRDYMQIVALTLFLSSGVFAVVALVTQIRQARGWERVAAIEQRHGELTKLLKQRDLDDLIRRVEERESSDRKGESMQAAVDRLVREQGLEIERGAEDRSKQYNVTLKSAPLQNIVRFLAALRQERPDIYCAQLSLVPARTSRSTLGATPEESSKMWVARLLFGSFATMGQGG